MSRPNYVDVRQRRNLPDPEEVTAVRRRWWLRLAVWLPGTVVSTVAWRWHTPQAGVLYTALMCALYAGLLWFALVHSTTPRDDRASQTKPQTKGRR